MMIKNYVQGGNNLELHRIIRSLNLLTCLSQSNPNSDLRYFEILENGCE